MNRLDAFTRRCKRHVVRWLLAIAAVLASCVAVQAETVLRIVMNSDLKIIDPIWNTAFVIRDHGYMIYDTLFATDAQGEIRPQMVDTTEVSADKLTYTFTLRDGLKWHDGQPVTAEDCVASIKRWAARDAVGQKLMTFVAAVEAKDARTLSIRLKEPTGLLLPALGKPNSNVPFMMPRRVAETDPFTQITDSTGSGPFIFKRELWRPGHLAVYVKNPDYKPRPEPVSRLAGGKRALVDRIEWHAMPDHLQAINALQAGEIDFIEAPPFDLHALLKADKNVQLMTLSPVGSQNIFRLNHLHKPFDNPMVRRALWYAFNQEDFLKAVIGDPDKYKACKALFICGTAYASDKGMDGLLESNFAKAARAPEAGGLRRHARRAAAVERSLLADQPRAGGQAADGEGRLQGRHAADGLAEHHHPHVQEEPARAGRLACLPDLALGHGPRRPGVEPLPQFVLRQGLQRLALRSRDGEAARPLRPRDRSGQAQGNRRGSTGPRHRVDALRLSRRMAPGFRRPYERHGIHLGWSDGVLERREEVKAAAGGFRSFR